MAAQCPEDVSNWLDYCECYLTPGCVCGVQKWYKSRKPTCDLSQ